MLFHFIASTFIALQLTAASTRAEPPTMTIYADRPAHAIPKSLYGIFFEEINHAGEGGLYAELIRNGTFEEPPEGSGGIPGWRSDGATLGLDTRKPRSAKAPRAMKMVVNGQEACVINDGYWGISLRKGESYRLRLDARGEGARSEGTVGPIRVRLESDAGKVVASATLGTPGEDWGRFEAELRPDSDVASGRLVLCCGGTGTVYFDTVSLFPAATWKNRARGMRRDLGTLVESLAPAFVRFPGGCYVEGGDFLKDAFRWSESIGDIAERPGHANANWGYWSSGGLGFHEYLQWCEDLGAKPMFVVNCGISHKEAVPLDKLQPWVDDCLNAIEYANGGVETRFGR